MITYILNTSKNAFVNARWVFSGRTVTVPVAGPGIRAPARTGPGLTISALLLLVISLGCRVVCAQSVPTSPARNQDTRQEKLLPTGLTPSNTGTSGYDAYALLTDQIRGLSHRDVLGLLPRFLALEPRLIFSLPIIPPVGRWSSNRLTSGFGNRRHPLRRQVRHHDGVDIAGPAQWIRSTASGRVVQTGCSTTLGLYVRIDHGNSYETLFGHLQYIAVRNGSVIAIDTPIGVSGHTGLTTGTHLHYAVRKNGHFIDPAAYMVAGSQLITWYQGQIRN